VRVLAEYEMKEGEGPDLL
jgi:hypothetical protein